MRITFNVLIIEHKRDDFSFSLSTALMALCGFTQNCATCTMASAEAHKITCLTMELGEVYDYQSWNGVVDRRNQAI